MPETRFSYCKDQLNFSVEETEKEWQRQKNMEEILRCIWEASTVCNRCKKHNVCAREIAEVIRFYQTYRPLKRCLDFEEAFAVKELQRPLRGLIY